MELRNRSITQEMEALGHAVIKPIDQETVRYISGGEKISNIESAIRELIENSIDAQAKYIEVRLVKFGVDSIEVDDNGTGIDKQDFETLGQRYHTSKITDYTKLQESLETFGFRGEALSCLSKVANITIITKSARSPTGTKLIFNNGTLASTEPVARANGTTVIVKNLFQSMPVRRRELETTAKRQYDKVVKLLYEQILARPFIKFALYKKNTLQKKQDFAHGGCSLEACIITIFGAKVLESLTPIKQSGIARNDRNDKTKSGQQAEYIKLASDADDDAASLVNKINIEPAVEPSRDFFNRRSRKSKFAREKPEYTVYGYISKIRCGRNSTDCQFIYVNKKPCDIPKVTKLVNEIYRNYSNNQYPFLCLFIQVQTWAADFNVPRKREVILQDEARLSTIIKDSLDEMFSPSAPGSQKSCATAHIPISMPRFKRDNEDGESNQPSPKRRFEETATSPIRGYPHFIPSNLLLGNVSSAASNSSAIPSPFVTPATSPTNLFTIKDPCPAATDRIDNEPLIPRVSREPSPTTIDTKNNKPEIIIIDDASGIPTSGSANNHRPDVATTTKISSNATVLDQRKDYGCFQQVVSKDGDRLKVEIKNPQDLEGALARERAQRQPKSDSKEFSFAIHPNFNSVAEQELRFNLNKSSFEGMQVIGQFNKGFIISRLNEHLFIIDQHATDERANYEDQLQQSPLIGQPMVHPKPLYLNSIQENAIMNHVDAFKERGIEFQIDQSKMPGFKVMLASTSICKGNGIDVHLDKEDIEELIDVILESPNSLPTYTLKKVKNVAATRACRKSVMIGDPLSISQMSDIVFKMSRLENPWVCAHNRPTIRHLMDTDWL